MAEQRWGITIPLMGVSLADHRRYLEEIAELGFTDVWSSEAGAHDAFTPLALAAASAAAPAPAPLPSWTARLLLNAPAAGAQCLDGSPPR